MLTNFRSYAALDLRVSPAHVVICGPNGAGKTNVLEALSTLSPGRGLRGARLPDMARNQGDAQTPRPWAVSATVANPEGDVQLGAGYMPGGEAAARRIVRIDGVPAANPAQLAENVRLIWLTPSMDRLFLEGASERRRFVDRLIASFEPVHARRWAAYEIAMRERAGALRASASASWLSALERTMAEAAVSVAASRLAGIAKLSKVLDDRRGSAFPSAHIALAGSVEEKLQTRPAVEVEDEFAGILSGSRMADLESGRAAAGPHLTDFRVQHQEKRRAAQDCSTGEQKALLIRLVLAGAAMAAPGRPGNVVLLLDEIAAHLDDARRRALFEEIDMLGAQAWLTGTDESVFMPVKARATMLCAGDGQIRGI